MYPPDHSTLVQDSWHAAGLVLTIVLATALPASTAAGLGAPDSQAGLSTAERQATESPRPNSVVGTDPVQYQQRNNSTRHRNPDSSSVRQGNSDAAGSGEQTKRLRTLLATRLANRHIRSANYLQQRQYDNATALLGSGYRDQLGKYDEVVSEGDGGNVVSAFEETRTRQREFVATVEAFRETYDRYQTAKRTGEASQARELARNLTVLGERVTQQSEQLTQNYTRVSKQAGVNLSTARETTVSIRRNVTSVASAVGTAEFLETSLTVAAREDRVSFADPLEVDGQVRTADRPLSNQVVELEVGRRSYQTQTDDEGRFSVEYRPTRLPANASTVEVRYVPNGTSDYLASDGSLSVGVESVAGEVNVAESTQTAGFGDSVGVEGRLAVEERGVPDVPLQIVAGGTVLGQVRTADNGSFAFEEDLPVGIASGSRPLVVRPVETGRAVTPQAVSTGLEVTESNSTLTGRVERTDEVVVMSGALTTGGEPVPNQSVAVTVDGQRLGVAQTNEAGQYQFRVDPSDPGVPEIAGQSARLAFDGVGTNLAPTEAVVRVPARSRNGTPDADRPFEYVIQPGPVGSLESYLPDVLVAVLSSPLGLVVGGLSLGLVGLTVALGVRRRRESATDDDDGSSDPVAADAASTPQTEAAVDETRDRFASARRLLDEGSSVAAVRATYGTVRERLEPRVSERTRTHRQFLRAAASAGVDTDALRTVTDAYERAQYGSEQLPDAEVERAIDAGRTLVGETATADDAPADESDS